MSAPNRILLVNLGTPPAPTAAGVREFLREFLSDPMVTGLPWIVWQPILRGIILRTRPRRVAELYASIWTEAGSPLAVGTERIREAMAGELPDAEVRVAYRYLTPALAEELAVVAREAGTVTVVPLFPQETGATTGTIERVVDRVREKLRAAGELRADVRVAIPPPDCPGYVDALVARCHETFEGMAAAGAPEHLVVSFHGIPVRFDRRERGGYSGACRRTFEALLAGLQWDPGRATMTFQSRFGPEPWLTPATDRTLEALASGGTKSVAVVCPGFVTEGLETLEEIGSEGRELFLEAGGEDYALVPAVEAHPGFIRSLVHAATASSAGA